MGPVLTSTFMDAAWHSNSITDAIQMHYLAVKLIYFASESVHEWSYWKKNGSIRLALWSQQKPLDVKWNCSDGTDMSLST